MLNSTADAEDFGGVVITRLTVEWLMTHLSEEERAILWLHEIEELTLEEIGKIIGKKYRGKELTGSAIRYHKDKILERLQQYRSHVGQ
jgi:DNA-directed RNA polymerase specialized sigma24 family protein